MTLEFFPIIFWDSNNAFHVLYIGWSTLSLKILGNKVVLISTVLPPIPSFTSIYYRKSSISAKNDSRVYLLYLLNWRVSKVVFPLTALSSLCSCPWKLSTNFLYICSPSIVLGLIKKWRWNLLWPLKDDFLNNPFLYWIDCGLRPPDLDV